MRRSTAVESWLNARPGLRTLVEDVELDGVIYTDLSAAGELLFAAAKEYRPSCSLAATQRECTKGQRRFIWS